ncbi:F-box/kelch-repeat protein At5g43190, partial [Linum perenne]
MRILVGKCFGWKRRKKILGNSASTVALLLPASSKPLPTTSSSKYRRRFPFFLYGGSSVSSKRRVNRCKRRFYYSSSPVTATSSELVFNQNSTRIDSASPSANHQSSTSPAMDPTIWKGLPEELLDQVLSLVPVQSLLNLRSTCKRIDSLFLSPYFISNYYSSSSSQPFSSFLLLSHPHFGHHRFAVYDSLRRRWRNSPLPASAFLPGFSPAPRRSSSFTLLASAKGLLCFSRPSTAAASSFLICNVLTRSTRVVKFPNYPFANESITLVPTPSGYKIFTLCPGTSRSVFVYDSAIQRWHKSDCNTPNINANYHREGVVYDGSLYFYTGEPYSIVGYDLEARKWDVLNGQMPGGGRMVFMRLVSNGEKKMYLIGGIAKYWILSEVKIWELDGERNWVEIGSLPEEMCRKFVGVCYHNYEHVYCMWHRGMICLCCYTWPEILYYDVAAGEWGWLPKCPLLPEKGSCGFTWFSVVP